MKKYRVFIARVPEGYNDINSLQKIILRGLEELDLLPLINKKVLIKPNLVMVDKKVARDCFTRPEIIHAFLRIIHQKAEKTIILENSGRGVPTYRMMRKVGQICPFYKHGYFSFEELYPSRVFCRPIDEDRLLRYRLSWGDLISLQERENPELCDDDRKRYYAEITTSRHYADADCIVYMPKLKSNVLGNGLTAALKLGGIGNLLDKDRMPGHNNHNDRRIVDMLEVAFPQIIITDAIVCAVGGNQMTERGQELKALIIADNPVAHDMVAAQCLNLDPSSIRHLMIAANRQYGPATPEEIEITGDFPLKEVQQITSTWDLGFIKVPEIYEKIKKESGIELAPEIISGEPYSIPGTHGVFLDWFYMNYDYPPTREKIKNWPSISIVLGSFEATPTRKKVVLVGDKAIEKWRSIITSSKGINFPSWLQKYLGIPKRIERYRSGERKGWAFHIPGDPPAHKDLIMSFFLASNGKMKASLFRLSLIIDTYFFSIKQWLKSIWNNRHGIDTVSAPFSEKIKELR